MKIDWKPSFKLVAITFLILGLTYIGCFLPAFGFDDGTNPGGELCYRIIGIIGAPLSFLNTIITGWIPFFLIVLFDLIIWAIIISTILKISISILSRTKKTK